MSAKFAISLLPSHHCSLLTTAHYYHTLAPRLSTRLFTVFQSNDDNQLQVVCLFHRTEIHGLRLAHTIGTYFEHEIFNKNRIGSDGTASFASCFLPPTVTIKSNMPAHRFRTISPICHPQRKDRIQHPPPIRRWLPHH